MNTRSPRPRVAAAGDAQLQEVVVTAEKRPQPAQQVPASLAVFASQALQASGIASLEAVAARTPGFTFKRFNLGEPNFYIRGVGSNTDSAAGDPSVGVFLDEMYVGRASGAAFDLLDMDRVEVLRGPQGTLYGRNTSGGAVNLVPRRPTREFAANAALDLGDYGLRTLRGAVNAPVGTASAL